MNEHKRKLELGTAGLQERKKPLLSVSPRDSGSNSIKHTGAEAIRESKVTTSTTYFRISQSYC